MSLDATLSPGQLLSRERESQHKSHNDIARQLRLTLGQVQALENDNYAALPGTTFVRGFMRNYAKLLGMDAEALLRVYEASLPPAPIFEEPLPEPKARPQVQIAAWATMALIFIAVLGFTVNWFNPDLGNLNFSAQTFPPNTSATSIHNKNAHPKENLRHSSTNAIAKPIQNSPAAPLQIAARDGERSDALTSPEGAPTKEMPDAAGPSETQEILARLKFFFNEDAWVEVRDQDHQKVFAHLNIKGTEKVVDAAPPLTLIVGNARAVRVTYNDNEVDLTPHIKNNIARFNLD